MNVILYILEFVHFSVHLASLNILTLEIIYEIASSSCLKEFGSFFSPILEKLT